MTDTNRPLRVFLCHSSADKPAVRELYQKLRAEKWIQPWLDEEELHPGQTWEMEIEKAVESSDVVLVCLSNSSINKRGYVQKELRFALDIALEMPEETIFIIPLRLEDCTPPRSLREWQYADYYPEAQRQRALERLIVSLERRADSLGLIIEEPIEKDKTILEEARTYFDIKRLKDGKTPTAELKIRLPKILTVEWIKANKITLSNGMEFMCVPAGKFIMGSNEYERERPQHTVDIPFDYWIGRYPITNIQFSQYKKNDFAKGKENHPVVYVSWDDAQKFVKWMNKNFVAQLPKGYIFRLPSESEWEKAARGAMGFAYPWGNEADINKCNSIESGKKDTTPVGLYSPQGDSTYGCADMAGNVWEWTRSFYRSYPYNPNDGREDEKSESVIVLVRRGGSFADDHRYSRSVHRDPQSPYFPGDRNCGFRIVTSRSPTIN